MYCLDIELILKTFIWLNRYINVLNDISCYIPRGYWVCIFVCEFPVLWAAYAGTFNCVTGSILELNMESINKQSQGWVALKYEKLSVMLIASNSPLQDYYRSMLINFQTGTEQNNCSWYIYVTGDNKRKINFMPSLI